MARLRSRTLWPPHGFQMLFPQAGQPKPFTGSFNEVVTQTMKFLRSNPSLVAKYQWPTEQADVETWVDESNAARMLAHGWTTFVADEAPTPQRANTVQAQKKSPFQNAVVGAKALTEWLGAGGKPVIRPLAEQRAAICATCPRNSGGNWMTYFTRPVADHIRYLLSVKHDLDLNTPYDEKLTVCEACDCTLSLKVWTPVEVIANHTEPAVLAKLDPRCWVLSEMKQNAVG